MGAPTVEILGTGRLDDSDSAFPQAVQLPSGDVLCSFSDSGGPGARGGSAWARSRDGGETWALEGNILAQGSNPDTTNALKLSLSRDGQTIYAYGSRSYPKPAQRFGEARNEAVFCTSIDGGHTWSPPRVVPMPGECPLEITHGILALSSGRLLAPAATLPTKSRLGEQALVAVSDDGGSTWPAHGVVFQDPHGRHGYFEQKLSEVAPGRALAAAWTVTLGDVQDRQDSFSISNDGGLNWSAPASTGIEGQTMTPVPLGGDRLLVLYNRLYGDQGVVMALVTFTENAWTVHYEGMMYDARAKRGRPEASGVGVKEMAGFEFGFPTAIRLHDGTFLATHWSKEGGRFGIRWTKLRVGW